MHEQFEMPVKDMSSIVKHSGDQAGSVDDLVGVC
jgi:hypothetical protein